jgi:hypothetical protein
MGPRLIGRSASERRHRSRRRDRRAGRSPLQGPAGDVRKDCDCHWAISECYAYGRHGGWIIEHHGYCYDGFENGEDGPFPTRVEAEVVLIEHLLAAIAAIEARED